MKEFDITSYINHTFLLLEDCGLHLNYPAIDSIKNGKQFINGGEILIAGGRRVTIDQNLVVKFITFFSILDFFIDLKYPALAGKAFAKKYENLPSDNDYDLILKNIFRIMKIIRNVITHSVSSLTSENGVISAKYKYRNKDFSIKIDGHALSIIYTLISMYVRSDLGKGEYFLSFAKTMYTSVCNKLEIIDEFKDPITIDHSGLKLNTHRRMIILDQEYEREEYLKFKIPSDTKYPPGVGFDFLVKVDGEYFLVPKDALTNDFMISVSELKCKWKFQAPYIEEKIKLD